MTLTDQNYYIFPNEIKNFIEKWHEKIKIGYYLRN